MFYFFRCYIMKMKNWMVNKHLYNILIVYNWIHIHHLSFFFIPLISSLSDSVISLFNTPPLIHSLTSFLMPYPSSSSIHSFSSSFTFLILSSTILHISSLPEPSLIHFFHFHLFPLKFHPPVAFLYSFILSLSHHSSFPTTLPLSSL